jgi:hypothetical protein
VIEGSGSIPLTDGSGSGPIEAQKHTDLTDPDPDSDPDPQHCVIHTLVFVQSFQSRQIRVIFKESVVIFVD